MGWMMNVLIIPFAVLSMVVNTLGVTSLFRFKDVYMRMHGATKCSTLGALFASLAVIVYAITQLGAGGGVRFAVLIVHVVLALFGLLIGNSTSAHVLSRAAYRSGILPKLAVIDEYAEFNKKEMAEELAEALAVIGDRGAGMAQSALDGHPFGITIQALEIVARGELLVLVDSPYK